MNVRSLIFAVLIASPGVFGAFACGGSSDAPNNDSGTGNQSGDGGSGNGQSDGGGANDGAGGGGNDGGGGGDSGGTFPMGTICNSSGTPLTPPANLKNLIVILFENEDYGSVNGSASAAPYINSIANKCGVATGYNDNCFAENLVSLPHYLALTSGSNCNSGLDESGSGCIKDDNDTSSHTLTTKSIFDQVSSWRSYQEAMPSACDGTSSGEYAAKHNPAAYYTGLSSCSTNDVSIPAITCDASKTNTACTPAPSNAFTNDLTNDTLAAFTFVTPTLLNDMHDGTITQADNWLYTYLPLILQSKAYLRGDVAIQLLWDEQSTPVFGHATPNVFVSPYINAGAVSSTTMNHFAMLRAWENALGITTYLGCASGTPTGGSGTCPAGSTTDVRAALNW